MYEKIQHPKTGKWHNINSSLGNKLIKGYAKKINQTGGTFVSRLKDVLARYQLLEQKYSAHQAGRGKYSMNQAEYRNIMQEIGDVGNTIDNLLSTVERINPSHFVTADRTKTRWPSGITRIDNDIRASRARLIKMHDQTLVTGGPTETAGFGESLVRPSATTDFGASLVRPSATTDFGASRVRPSPPAPAAAASLFDQPRRGSGPQGRSSSVQSQIAELERQTREAQGRLASNLQQQQQDKRDQAALAKARLARGQALSALYAAQDKARARVGVAPPGGNFFAGNAYKRDADRRWNEAHPPAAPPKGGLFGPDPLPVIPAFGPKGLGDGHNSPVYLGQRAQWKARRAAGAPGPAPFPGFGKPKGGFR